MALQTIDLFADYDALAAEYYDAARHPTCANFREASKAILRTWLSTSRSNLVYCDLGVGKSLLAEILQPSVKRLNKMYLVDDSSAMLSYSSQWAERGAHLILADVSRFVPLETGSVDVAVASLGDPYNVGGFWAEVRRVVRPGGRIFYTTPSYQWATSFRSNTDGGHHAAEFALSSGTSVSVPSYIYECAEQTELVERYGLVLDEIASVATSALTETPVSPKLLIPNASGAGVVTGYALTRPK